MKTLKITPKGSNLQIKDLTNQTIYRLALRVLLVDMARRFFLVCGLAVHLAPAQLELRGFGLMVN
jgi:hypothetical protein